MDKKREIDQLMHEYLNFYQHDKQDIPIKNVNDFDQLMHQYKSKFDKQIAIEQKAIQEKEKQRVLQKKLEQTKKNTPKKTITKPPPKTKSFRNKYNHNNDRSNHLKTVIFTIVMLIIIAVVTITTTDFDDNHFSEFNSGISQGEEISQDNLLSYFNISDAILIEANELPVMDNIPDSKNFTRVKPISCL